ncbi:MAG: hypothetical protein LBU25_09315 [Treponema sp.]|jgi:hypothetical protein|nr:hypothetical protein [Treponema sp.]
MANMKILLGTPGIALVFIVLALFSGCRSTITSVKDIPESELSELDLSTNYITITSFDGKSVHWKKGIGGILTSTTVELPTGKHTLEGNYYDGTNRANGLNITYDFVANHKYTLLVQFQGGGLFQSGTASFNIMDMTR